MKIQVVGRLVQQKDLRFPEDEPGKVHPGLLPAGKLVKKLPPHSGRNIQTVAYLVQVDLGLIASLAFKEGGKGIITLKDRLIPFPHLLGQFPHFLLHSAQVVKGSIQHVLHRIFRGIDGDLGDKPHPLTGSGPCLPLVGEQLPGKDLKEGGLARAVPAQETHPFPLKHLEGEAV
jgi:hypothetical protein